ncbi:MAG: CusA/CzcA family heavy metal efflux RND transporter [Polyangiales bacterium]
MDAIVRASIRHRAMVLAIALALCVAAAFVARRMTFDALPDITSNQVLVLTTAPGLTPEEVERLVTRPIETAIGGTEGLVQQRSLSRYGISSVTAVFDEDITIHKARQLVAERIQRVAAELPDGVAPPELGPNTGGLGEVYQVAVASPVRSQAELLEMVNQRVAPLLRAIPGVVEVNPWGGAVRTLDVTARPADLARLRLTLGDLHRAVSAAVGAAAGESLPAGARQVLLRGVAWPRTPDELAAALVVARPGEAPVHVGDVADVAFGIRGRIGAATADGRGEVVYLMVQMLRGANALAVLDDLHRRLPAVRAALPADVTWTPVYDRSVLVHRTLRTVARSLAEGGALVVVVLLALLGSLRAGALVAAVIPLAMLGAAALMTVTGVPGDLMSLGALDFGLLVDGAVVMVEGIFHALGAHRDDDDATRARRVEEVAASLARPVFYGVLVITLVYVPVLALQDVDGKMFRPMALTVIFALSCSLLLALTAVPAAASLLLRPRDVPARAPWLFRAAERAYGPVLDGAVGRGRRVALLAGVLLLGGAAAAGRVGASFIPQLDEGDLVVQSTRAPDISLAAAIDDAQRMERAFRAVPEVRQVVSRIGSPAVATDIMGLEQADVFVGLAPRAEWRRGLDRDGLIAELQRALATHDPRNDAAFTQPIQMRFNELIGGSVTDVDVSVYGDDLREIRAVADAVAEALHGVPGADDVRVLAPPEVPLAEVVPRPGAAARFGWTPRDVLDAVAALRQGVDAGDTYDGPVRVPVRVLLPPRAGAFALADTALPAASGELVPLGSVADVRERGTPGLVSRQGAQRRLVVGFNVRGADLGTVVEAAERRAAAVVRGRDSVRLVWGGQYESFEAARGRLAVVIPAVLVAIVLVLLWTFRHPGPVALILLNVPFACVGGAVLLWARRLPLSMPAAVGFIALSGVAVLNGVVWSSRLLQRRAEGAPWGECALDASRQRMRPVLMTALVALLGFVPMMLATGTGAEVQRPLATVVVGGLPTSTVLTLVILPALVAWYGRLERRP